MPNQAAWPGMISLVLPIPMFDEEQSIGPLLAHPGDFDIGAGYRAPRRVSDSRSAGRRADAVVAAIRARRAGANGSGKGDGVRRFTSPCT